MKPLTLFFRRISKNRNIFWGLGIAFSVMVAAIGIFGFIFLSAFAIRNWFERQILESALIRSNIPIEQAGTAAPVTSSRTKNPLIELFNAEKQKSLFTITPERTASLIPQDSLGYEIFYDLFSGNGWIDQGRTNLYHERVVTAFLLPPKFSFSKVTGTGTQFIERKADGSDERCIRGRCLVAREKTLVFQGNALELPESVRKRDIVGVSVGALEKTWMVGVTTRSGEDYLGWLFSFDGSTFRNVQREEKEMFLSRYAGAIGFGGSDDDWMAVYGAYEGKAVRVRGGAIDDISRFFGIRVMGGGLDPEITRTGSGDGATWFVWNKGAMPKLLKLFQNGTEKIEGAIDLTNEFGADLQGVTSLFVAPASDSHTLVVKMIRDGSEEYWRFVDEGFDTAAPKEIVSASLTNRILPVVLASIERLEYADAGAAMELFLSNDNLAWEETKIGETVTFGNQGGDKLFWKIRVDAPRDKFSSPYFGQIEVDYALKKGI